MRAQPAQRQSQIWKWIIRIGGVVGLLGGGLAIYEYAADRRLLVPIAVAFWMGLFVWARISKERRRETGEQATAERLERVEAKIDRLLAHFDVERGHPGAAEAPTAAATVWATTDHHGGGHSVVDSSRRPQRIGKPE